MSPGQVCFSSLCLLVTLFISCLWKGVGNSVKKDSQDSLTSGGSRQQPEQQFTQPQLQQEHPHHQQEHPHHHEQQQQEHPHHHVKQQSHVEFQDQVYEEAADHGQHFHIDDKNRQGQQQQQSQQQQSQQQQSQQQQSQQQQSQQQQFQQENRHNALHQQPQSQLPLGQTDQDKARANEEEEVLVSHTENELHQPTLGSDHSDNSDSGDASDDKLSSDDDGRLEAPHADQLPLGTASLPDQHQQAQGQQIQAQAQFQQPEDPLSQQRADNPSPHQQLQQPPPGVIVDDPHVGDADDKGQDESLSDAAKSGSSFEYRPEEAEYIPTEAEIE
ncbi:unnamed protein product, partial [Candidula unifasciata]